MTIQQMFCSVMDMIADAEKPGGDEARVLQAIREASDELQKEIGWFIPVTQTTFMRGSGNGYLYPFPPVLSLTGSVMNDATTLVVDTDFSFLRRAWANGPYLGLELKYASGTRAWCNLDPDSVEIPCRAGFYERAANVGTEVAAQQAADDDDLDVVNGGKVSPGMILKLGDEQELVTGWGAPAEAVVALEGAISSTDTILTLETGDGDLVEVGEIVRFDFEQMRIKDKRSDQIFVERNWNNTGQVAHLDNADGDVYRTVTVERAVNGTTAAVHAQDLDIERYLVPDDILFLTKQIATLMINKARSGYAGKTGGSETGTVFYHDVFPRFEIDRVKENYVMGDS